MQSKSINKYIFFGTSLRYFQDIQMGSPIHGNGYILENFERLFSMIKELNLVVVDRSMPAINLARILGDLSLKEQGYRLTQEDAISISQYANQLRTVIDAETAGHYAFIVTDKKIDTTKLLQNVGSLFNEGAFDALNSLARYDFMEAGKCIAFERPTAAAFHMLRGTESVLRDFYSNCIKKNRVKDLLWHPMIESLRKKPRNKPPKELLDNLDNIRFNFRNPTQHPEKIYDISEVQDLFWLCVDAVNRMHSAMRGVGRK